MGFRVQGSGFRVQGSGFRLQGSGFRVQASGFRVQGSGFRVTRTSCPGRCWDDLMASFRASGLGFIEFFFGIRG